MLYTFMNAYVLVQTSMSAWNGHFNVRIPHSAAKTPKVLINATAKMDFTGLTKRAKVRGLALTFWSTGTMLVN